MARSLYIPLLIAVIAAIACNGAIAGPLPTGGLLLDLDASSGVTSGGSGVTAWNDANNPSTNWVSSTVQYNGSGPVLSTATFGNGSHPVVAFTNSQGNGVYPTAQLGTGLILTGIPNTSLTAFSVYVVGNMNDPVAQFGNEFVSDFDVNHAITAAYGWAVGTANANDNNNAQDVKFFTSPGSDLYSDGQTGLNYGATSSPGLFNIISASYLPTGQVPNASKYLTASTNGQTYTPANGAPLTSSVGSSIAYTNSMSLTLGFDNTQSTPSDLSFGFLNGNIAQVLIYNDAGLNATQLAAQDAAVHSYLYSEFFAPVPEPSSLALLSLGCTALIARSLFRRRQTSQAR